MTSVLFRKVWDAVSGDEVLTLAHKHIVKTVSFTQVGVLSGYGWAFQITCLWIWSCLYISCMHLCCCGDWDISHCYNCYSIYFCLSSQDSNCLLTGGNDKLLRIYDLSNPEAGKRMCQRGNLLLQWHVKVFVAQWIMTKDNRHKSQLSQLSQSNADICVVSLLSSNVVDCCIFVSNSTPGDCRSHLSHKKSLVVQQWQADPLCCRWQNHTVSEVASRGFCLCQWPDHMGQLIVLTVTLLCADT